MSHNWMSLDWMSIKFMVAVGMAGICVGFVFMFLLPKKIIPLPGFGCPAMLCFMGGVIACLNASSDYRLGKFGIRLMIAAVVITVLVIIYHLISNHISKDYENNQIFGLTQYANYTGRDKRIAMLRDQVKDKEAAKSAMDQCNQMIVAATQEKTTDSSIVGGLVSGIAGAAAGVAAAVQTELDNERIRRENRERLNAVMPLVLEVSGAASQYEDEAVYLRVERGLAKTKKIGTLSTQDLFRKLSFSSTELEVTSYGSFTVNTVVNAPVLLIDKVRYVIDGSVAAKIYRHKELVGVAQMVFPTYGAGKDTELQGACYNRSIRSKTGTVDKKQFRVEIVPVSLWAIEL